MPAKDRRVSTSKACLHRRTHKEVLKPPCFSCLLCFFGRFFVFVSGGSPSIWRCHLKFGFRYEGAVERKTKIMEIIRSLDLPNNPLDDIIDQVILSYCTFSSQELFSSLLLSFDVWFVVFLETLN